MEAGQTFPIDPELIALEVTKQRFTDPITKVHGHEISGIEGMLKKNGSGSGWFLLYDKTVKVKGRINFTIAHELGHYLLHRIDAGEFECGQSDMLKYDSPESVSREKEANLFASYLLMPISDYKQQIERQIVNLDLIGRCAERYGVSLTSATLKWIEFTDEVAVVVVARDDFVLWSFPSTKARKLSISCKRGTPIPDAVLERFKRFSLVGENSNTRVPPGVWHPQYEAVESAIFSDQYEMQIFLIRFPSAEFKDFGEEYEGDMVDFMNLRSQGLGWKK